MTSTNQHAEVRKGGGSAPHLLPVGEHVHDLQAAREGGQSRVALLRGRGDAGVDGPRVDVPEGDVSAARVPHGEVSRQPREHRVALRGTADPSQPRST